AKTRASAGIDGESSARRSCWSTSAEQRRDSAIMRNALRVLLCVMIFCAAGLAQWKPQQSGTTARFRGVSAVSPMIAWASGSGGTFARTTNGGATWEASVVPDASQLDFRDVHAVDADTAYLLSIGPGEASKIYKTTNAGRDWALQFINRNPKAFFDAFAFWDANSGIAMSTRLMVGSF